MVVVMVVVVVVVIYFWLSFLSFFLAGQSELSDIKTSFHSRPKRGNLPNGEMDKQKPATSHARGTLSLSW